MWSTFSRRNMLIMVFLAATIMPTLVFNKRTRFDTCQLFDIAKENCTCEYLNRVFKNPDGSPLDICLVDQHTKKGTLETLEIFNSTSRQPLYHHRSFINTIFASVKVTAAIASIIGNSIVIVVAVAHRKTISTFKRIIASLAICDLTFAVLGFIREIPDFWTGKWVFGTAFCKIFEATVTMGANIAIGIILIISVERYVGIVHPFGKGLYGWKLYMLEILNVFFALCTAIPIFMYEQVDEHGYCIRIWPHVEKARDSRIYRWFEVVFYLLLPTFVLSVLYLKIILHLQKSLSKIESSVDVDMCKKRQKDNRRIMKILICILTSFVILVGPYHVSILSLDYLYGNSLNEEGYYEDKRDTQKIRNADILYFIMFLTYPFHTAVNPAIYSIVDKKWRKDVLKIIGRWKTKSHSCKLQLQNQKADNRSLHQTSPAIKDQFRSRILVTRQNTQDTVCTSIEMLPSSWSSGFSALKESRETSPVTKRHAMDEASDGKIIEKNQVKEYGIVANVDKKQQGDTKV